MNSLRLPRSGKTFPASSPGCFSRRAPALRRLFAASALTALAALSGCHTSPSAAPSPAAPAPSAAPSSIAGASNASSPAFVDVAKDAGLNYAWKIEGKRPLTILQTIGNGCAFLDYDNDGNLDILLVGPHPALFRGDGKGHFTDVTRETGLDKLSGRFLGCAVGDYDNDGYPDIYLSAFGGGVLLHNVTNRNGLGPQGGHRAFVDVTQSAGLAPQPWGTSCTFTDFDGDGKLDLYIGNYVRFGPDVQPQLCDFHGVLGSCGPRYYKPTFGVLYHNLGGGRFEDVTRAQGLDAPHVAGKALGVAAADYDQSGRPSLAVANDEMPGDLLRANGKAVNTSYKNVALEAGVAFGAEGGVHGGMGLDWGDYDNDGKLDLCVATYQQEPKCLYHNMGEGLFNENSARLGLAEKTMPYIAFGVKFLDYDNDGFLDLMFANGHVSDNIADIDHSAAYRQPTQLFHNAAGGRFMDMGAQAGPAFRQPIVGRGLAVGDFDNDGKIDALVVDSEGAPLLLHNVTPSKNHWLLCRLVGTRSNRDGIGAMITVERQGGTGADNAKLLRHCATDGSYLSASDKRVHIGLGSATSATLTVRWPSGAVTTYKDIAADRVVTLTEGAGQSAKAF